MLCLGLGSMIYPYTLNVQGTRWLRRWPPPTSTDAEVTLKGCSSGARGGAGAVSSCVSHRPLGASLPHRRRHGTHRSPFRIRRRRRACRSLRPVGASPDVRLRHEDRLQLLRKHSLQGPARGRLWDERPSARPARRSCSRSSSGSLSSRRFGDRRHRRAASPEPCAAQRRPWIAALIALELLFLATHGGCAEAGRSVRATSC